MRFSVICAALTVLAAGCDAAQAQDADDTGECVVCDCECPEPPTVRQHTQYCDGSTPYEWEVPDGAALLGVALCYHPLSGGYRCQDVDRVTLDGVLDLTDCEGWEPPASGEARMVVTYVSASANL